MSSYAPLFAVIGVMLFWVVLGLAGLARSHDARLVFRVLFPLGSIAGAIPAAAGLAGISGTPAALVLPLGLPGLPFHLRLDPLSSFFLLLLGFAAAGISMSSAAYFRKTENIKPGLIGLQYHLFLASMLAVCLADDAYFFLVAWETMALSSYFLVITDHKLPEVRRAGFLYLLIAHLGAISILLCFGVMQNNAGEYTFELMRAARLSDFWATVVFLLALTGFGAKAGFLPLHIWLPE